MAPLTLDEMVLTELMGLAQREPSLGLGQFCSLVSAHQYKLLYALMRRYVPIGASVLDWGVGNGHFSYYLTRAGYAAHGFSLAPCELQPRLEPEGYQFVQGNPAEPVQLPFPDASFEAVVSVGVLEHVREMGGEEQACLREIRRILHPGGWFICYHFPNRYSAVEMVVRRLSQKYHHPYRFTRHDIDHLVRGAQLDLLESRRYGSLPRNFWNAPPDWVRNSPFVAAGWNGLDRLCTVLFSPVCQNYLFVAQRPRCHLGAAE